MNEVVKVDFGNRELEEAALEPTEDDLARIQSELEGLDLDEWEILPCEDDFNEYTLNDDRRVTFDDEDYRDEED